MAGSSVNKVILLGHLGGDPELRYTGSGKAVAGFTVATSEYAGRDREPQTEWHRIVVWDKLAELCNQYLHKGRQVYIEGRLQTRSWEDRNGQKRYTTEIVAQQVIFLGGGQARASRQDPYGQPLPPPSRGAPAEGRGGQRYAAEPPAGEVDDVPPDAFGDDDIPF